MKENKALITADDLSMVEESSLNEQQLQHILKRTPAAYVKERPGKGGKRFKYVTGGYIKKCLNLMFGFDWDFEVVRDNMDQVMMGTIDEVIVLGKLTCRSNGKQITKNQYGCKDIAFTRKDNKPVSLGNDFKAAATDSLKKCAAEIGIAALKVRWYEDHKQRRRVCDNYYSIT